MHFGNSSLVKNYATHELYSVVTHVQNSLSGFANDGKGFGKKFIKTFSTGNSIPNYVPAEGYLTMVETVRELRGE